MLNNAGYEVINTHPTDPTSTQDSLKQRVEKANSQDANLFLSIHFNSSDNKNASGVEVFYNKNNSKLEKLGNEILNNFDGYNNRGYKKGNFYVLKNSTMDALLIECGFVSNTQDMAKYNALEIAKNIFKAIDKVN